MKKFLLLFLLVTSQLSFSQSQKIAQLLNKQLQKEMTHFYTDEEKKNFIVTEPFRIDENNILHFGFTVIKNIDSEKMSIKRETPLDKIVALNKDLNVYFQTLGNDVIETQTTYDKKGNVLQIKTEQTHLFITEINREHYPNRFMKRLAKAFKKVGYSLE